MIIDKFGQIIVTESELIENLYQGKITNFNHISVESKNIVDKFNFSIKTNADNLSPLKLYQSSEIDLKEFDKTNQQKWFMPDEYKKMDIEGFLVYQCPKQNYDRLMKELQLYRKHNMIDLLRYLKYLVDTLRNNNIVWGVGRGSSVASYCLFLIGIHKIDSIKYNLDIQEFFKEGD